MIWDELHQRDIKFESNIRLFKNKLITHISRAWWCFMPGTTIVVKWPVGPIIGLDDIPTGSESADPNDHYRPWLEANVGKQLWDWDWDWGTDNQLLIRFRRGKESLMTEAFMKWS